MLVVCAILILLPNGYCHDIFKAENNQNLITCVTNIVSDYYSRFITYVDINAGGNEIMKAINSLSTFLVISRTTNVKLEVPNLGYLIFANNSTDFTDNFHNLDNEACWKPSKRFLIIIKYLDENTLKDIFDTLLKLNIINAVVINGTGDADIYTYNPYENYACGNYYERIIPYGKCQNTTGTNLFPNKLVTGLRRCTIRVLNPHLPPYSMDPTRDKNLQHFGLEQFAFAVLSQLEGFAVKTTYQDFAEQFSSFDGNLKASGSFRCIQNNETDVLLGFTMLSSERSDAFDFLYKHIAFSDELTVVVKRAGYVPVWKNMYMEFDGTVWILLAVAFICVLFVFIVIFRFNDTTVVFLKLWDNLLQHGYYHRNRSALNTILIAWIWFTFLVNSFYQSSLVSLTTHPVESYQISKTEDLVNFKFKPCVSSALGEYLQTIAKLDLKDDVNGCTTMVQSMEEVSKTDGLYTIVPLSIYDYNKFLFIDRRGKEKTYHFSKPLSKIIYATFLYKGWPMYEKFDKITLRIRETGLMDYHRKYVYYQKEKQHKFLYDDSYTTRMIIPWNVLGIGAVVAGLIFIFEIISKHYPRSKKNCCEA